ncbi:MAG: hypothetical protein IJP99_08470 [Methanobrevibacter sp.]|nr:hypothetical protein [Methanobrevibacter sp.]
MTIKIIKKEFKHKDCDELNAELDSLISELSFESEGLTENFFDIVLDHANQREKDFSELYDAPLDWLESILINTQRGAVDRILNKLTDIVYTEKPKRQENMDSKKAREWLIDNVKPLILYGCTVQKDIAIKFGIDPNNGLMSKRVDRAYGILWDEYVEGVQNGRY